MGAVTPETCRVNSQRINICLLWHLVGFLLTLNCDARNRELKLNEVPPNMHFDLRYSLLCDVTQRRLFFYRSLGTTYQPHCQNRVSRNVGNYQYTLRNISEDLHRSALRNHALHCLFPRSFSHLYIYHINVTNHVVDLALTHNTYEI